ncbi:hypothetical protein QYE76_069313 [Lolium multiflorum]|uniref:CCHC-type domain-containing protein n=1 Tax=Lolium multiflorum TaxID=4521 RepID=A0AAD8SHS1_LOLMU|nr:hypothetical protein QYE76_069313 [Lolium multiflorum]
MFPLFFSPSSPALATLSSGSTSLPCNPLCPPLPERKPTRVRQRAPRAAQACRSWRGHAPAHATGTPRSRVASPQHASPGPPLCTLSFAVAAPTRLTRSRVLAPPVAVDTVDILPRPPPQTRTQCVVARPSPTSPASSLAPPRHPLPRLAPSYPSPSPEKPHPSRHHHRASAPSRAYKREPPLDSFCTPASFPPLSEPPLLLPQPHWPPEQANCSPETRNAQTPPPIGALPGYATLPGGSPSSTTSLRLAVDRRSSDGRSGPLPPPCRRRPRVDDDDDPPPHDLPPNPHRPVPIRMKYQWESYQLGPEGDLKFEKELKQLVEYLGHPYPKFFGMPLKAKSGEPPQWDVSTDLRRKLDAPMAPPARNNSRAQTNQLHIEHAKMTDTINILAMERKALRHQHAKKDYLIARLRVRIATLEQLIPIPNHAPRDKSTVTCYECGVTGHYSSKCPMKAANTAPRTGSNAVPVANEQDKSTITGYECGVVGHYSNECPKKLAKIAANTAALTQQQRHAATRRRFAPNYPNNRNGRYYTLTATEAQEAPQNMPTLATLSSGSTSLPCNPLCPPLPERKPTRVRQRAPRAAQACRSWRGHAPAHATGTPRSRVASPQHASPGPPLCTLSFAVAAPTRLTRSRVLAPPVAVDTVDILPRPPPQTRTQCVVARPSPTSPASSLAPPRHPLPRLAPSYPSPSPEKPHPSRHHHRASAPSRAYKREPPLDSFCTPASFPPLSEPPLLLPQPHWPPEQANCSPETRKLSQTPPPIGALPGDATATRRIAVFDNVAAHLAVDRRSSDDRSDPLPPPCQRRPRVDDDDDPPPHDLPLILRSAPSRTDSGE